MLLFFKSLSHLLYESPTTSGLDSSLFREWRRGSLRSHFEHLHFWLDLLFFITVALKYVLHLLFLFVVCTSSRCVLPGLFKSVIRDFLILVILPTLAKVLPHMSSLHGVPFVDDHLFKILLLHDSQRNIWILDILGHPYLLIRVVKIACGVVMLLPFLLLHNSLFNFLSEVTIYININD